MPNICLSRKFHLYTLDFRCKNCYCNHENRLMRILGSFYTEHLFSTLIFFWCHPNEDWYPFESSSLFLPNDISERFSHQ